MHTVFEINNFLVYAYRGLLFIMIFYNYIEENILKNISDIQIRKSLHIFLIEFGGNYWELRNL